MSVNDNLPGIQDELALIDRALREQTPLLGICLGSQMIAKALGTRFIEFRTEIGWEPVWLTEAGKNDAVLGGMRRRRHFFTGMGIP